MNKYTIKAYKNAVGRMRFYTTYSIQNLLRKIKELKELGYTVEVNDVRYC